MGKKVNRLFSYIYYLTQMIRTYILFKGRFKKCGKKVFFGRLSMIRGGNYMEIGDNCLFGNNLRIEAITSWLGGAVFEPSIKIGDRVVINQNFHCTCAESIEIGDGTSITANCGVFDIIHPYEDVSKNPREAKIETKPIKIGKDCLIGMNSVIMPGTELGNHCVVGANSTVSGVFPDYCVIAGSPARIIKKYDFETNKWLKTYESISNRS